MSTVLVVTQAPLGPTDLKNIGVVATSDASRPARIRVLVPAESHRSHWLEFLDQLALLDFGKAYASVTAAEKGPQTLQDQAEQVLTESLSSLERAGYEATGTAAVGSPLEAVRAEAASCDAAQALIITDPRPVEDSLNIGWAHEAAESLGIPVLHVYWGTEFIDD